MSVPPLSALLPMSAAALIFFAAIRPGFAQQAPPVQPPGPDAEIASVQAYGKAHAKCLAWTDLCVTCARGPAGEVNCSTAGIACTAQPIVCTAETAQ